MLSWRDTGNPEGGGAEVYLRQAAEGLVEQGTRVTVFTARYPGAAAREVVDGVRYVRRGGKLSVYLWGMALVLLGRLGPLGRFDAVVDVQNGLPFLSRLVTRRPVLVLVHHTHREQWPIVYPGAMGRLGWWIEGTLAPRLYRRCQYLTVSWASRDELAGLGVDEERIAVVHNGTAPQSGAAEKSAEPSMCVVGRLVPHKRVEHAIDALVALRGRVPGLTLSVVGSGWWEQELRDYAARAGADVVFTGYVSEEELQAIYARSWVMALPSLKEGWGLVVGEAGAHATPVVAYRAAGGTQESVEHGISGLLADDFDEFVAALETVLTDDVERKELAQGAQTLSRHYDWTRMRSGFVAVVAAVLRGDRVSGRV
ncbi:glycosyltransferase family 4 protein [Nocardioides sp.]|uniref:glycosyltransferase family 4 protein n=1 Tax=Nocardioides sp. TaxID=35761 RepID=UPI0039E6DABC